MFKEKGVEVQVSYSNLNIGHVIAFHPISGDWIYIPNTDQKVYDGMSEFEYKSMLERDLGPPQKRRRNVYDAHNNPTICDAKKRKNKAKSDKVKLKAQKKAQAAKEKAQRLKEQGKEDLSKPVELGTGNLKDKLNNIATQHKPTEAEEPQETLSTPEPVAEVKATTAKPRKKGSRIRAKY
jgi:hypothetical protein